MFQIGDEMRDMMISIYNSEKYGGRKLINIGSGRINVIIFLDFFFTL